MKIIKIKTPFLKENACKLKCGDMILLSGEIYTARDAAHKRLTETINVGEALPFELENAILYYVGPTPAMPGKAIGSAGPTTSGRMDFYTPSLISLGLTGMIGKGARSAEVVEALKKYKAVYFGALGGAGALLARCVESAEVIAYDDLGAEAIRRLTVKEMPLTVITDCKGNDLYNKGRSDYLKFRSGV